MFIKEIMVNGFYKQSRTAVTNQPTGYSQRAWIACMDWFDTIADTYADDVYVDGEHTFLNGLGFIQCYALPDSVEVPVENNGSAGALNKLWMPKMFIPGDSAALQAMMMDMKNEDLLFFVQDADFTITHKLQFGNKRVPARVNSLKPASGNIYEGRKGWEVELIATKRYIYNDSYTAYIMPPYVSGYVL